MICRADTMGVFQIESRAQMAMLPRLKPKCYYDLVIEVAIIRPGPIQGDMVHPYLRRRDGRRAGHLSERRRRASARAHARRADFSGAGDAARDRRRRISRAGEADQLRRAMAAWRRNGELEKFEARLIGGMIERGYSEEFAQRIFSQIKGFGEYGFPESHAASFALLVYVSAWLKHYEPAAFCCALLNSQPMGFYAPQQLVRSARDHGVEVRSVDVNHSDWDCTLERGTTGNAGRAPRYEAREGIGERGGSACVAARAAARFATRPGFGRESAAQCQGSGRARLGRRARRAREPSSPRALGGGRCGAAHGAARASCASPKPYRFCAGRPKARTSRPTIATSASA